MARRRKTADPSAQDKSYTHPTVETPMRPDVGTQAQFQGKKPPRTYRYDSSLAPALEWDGQNPAREEGERHLALVLNELTAMRAALAKAGKGGLRADALEALQKQLALATESARALKALSGPFLNWAGKAERLSFDVPTLPLFVHERLSTKAIIETLKGHRRDKQLSLYDLFGDPQRPLADHLRAYEHKDKWQNRMILGDSLPVMNSLLQYEGLGGQVQMIYMDPPYGVKFGSNFQPFMRKRDVKNNDDDDMTREPEMVQAYRDTWEVGLHSYLTCMRDRLLLCRELLAPSGSVFVQISDDNLHHLREVMDEVFGSENFIVQVAIQKTGSQTGQFVQPNADYVLWYAKDRNLAEHKFRKLFLKRRLRSAGGTGYTMVELPDGTDRPLTEEEYGDLSLLPTGSRIWSAYPLTSDGFRPTTTVPFEFEGKNYHPGAARHWGVLPEELQKVADLGRIVALENQIRLKRYFDDFPIIPLTAYWDDVGGVPNRAYVVQTSGKVVERCLLMTTDPGDLVLDPTCGSGTTAYVAEQWGRRWITIDVSRVPLALARQRLLTATFPWYDLKDDNRGPAGGFIYKRRQNRKGEEVGGIVPHVTLKSIANNEPPAEEVLVDRPEENKTITRVTGPFTFEATIPTAADFEPAAQAKGGDGTPLACAAGSERFPDRMIEVLRKSPVLRLEGNRTITFENVRPPAKALTLNAEAVMPLAGAAGSAAGSESRARGASQGQPRRVAFAFGPENGAVSEKLVQAAMREASIKGYEQLIVIGFAIQPNARLLIDRSADMGALSTLYVQATPDLLMGDLLKNMRSSQIFSVCGLPEVEVKAVKGNGKKNGGPQYQVTLLGLDVFDPVTMEVLHRTGNDVPAWFLDSDYKDRCFHVSQAFFPRTGAWDSLKRALKADFEEGVWDHLAGTTSAPFEAGEQKRIAVKVIDDRGNELMVVRELT